MRRFCAAVDHDTLGLRMENASTWPIAMKKDPRVIQSLDAWAAQGLVVAGSSGPASIAEQTPVTSAPAGPKRIAAKMIGT